MGHTQGKDHNFLSSAPKCSYFVHLLMEEGRQVTRKTVDSKTTPNKTMVKPITKSVKDCQRIQSQPSTEPWFCLTTDWHNVILFINVYMYDCVCVCVCVCVCTYVLESWSNWSFRNVHLQNAMVHIILWNGISTLKRNSHNSTRDTKQDNNNSLLRAFKHPH